MVLHSVAPPPPPRAPLGPDDLLGVAKKIYERLTKHRSAQPSSATLTVAGPHADRSSAFSLHRRPESETSSPPSAVSTEWARLRPTPTRPVAPILHPAATRPSRTRTCVNQAPRAGNQCSEGIAITPPSTGNHGGFCPPSERSRPRFISFHRRIMRIFQYAQSQPHCSRVARKSPRNPSIMNLAGTFKPAPTGFDCLVSKIAIRANLRPRRC